MSTTPSFLWRLNDWWRETTGRPRIKPRPSNDTLEGLKANLRRDVMKANKTGDGRISPQEWQAWRQKHPMAMDFDHFDMNEDGYITSEDIDAVATRRFANRERIKAREADAAKPDAETPKGPGSAP